MHYGTFDDENREYVITTPRTPLPWINYLGSEDFHSLISNTAGGYCFYKDALHRRILRYRYNCVPTDNGGRYFYIREGKQIWSPGWKPAKTELQRYECRHGLGYTRIKGSLNGLSASVLFFVPIGTNAEIHKLTLTNTTREKKQISLYSFVEWCLWNANDDMTNYQRNLSTGEVEIDGSTIYHKTEYRERRNHYAFYHVNQPVAGFDSDRDSFVGLYNGLDAPQAVVSGGSGNSIADGWSPIASHRLDLQLLPGESKDCVFVLGYVENPDDQKWERPKVIEKRQARQVIADFDSAEKVELALARLKKHWNEHLSSYWLDHGDERLARMVNIWNQYQCMTTFHMARSASYYETGISRGLGFRDTNQDLLGVVHQIPTLTRQRILDVASTQFEDGGCYHQYQPLTKKGNHAVGGNFSDDPLWLIESVSAYVKETGDFAILAEKVPFDNKAGSEASLFAHLARSFRYVWRDRGPHGLPLIKRADWNDCLNLNCFSTDPTDSFQTCTNKDGKVAESVFTAALFVHAGRLYAEIAERQGEGIEAEEARRAVAEMERAILEHGWDGEWFLRAYDDFSHKVGSQECAESKIFIEPQGFCSMAGIGLDRGYPSRALDAVAEHLATPYGIVLNSPAYQSYHLHLGEISSYPEGYKENGGIFCHNNPWIMIGETVIGRGDRAFDYYARICPSYLQDISELHRTEPYVYSQMVAGKEARRHGEAKNSWLTGTAAWNYVAITQHILGIQPDFDGLRVDPCIPPDWKEYSVRRRFRGDTYLIKVHNPEGRSKGVRGMKIDGKKVEGNLIRLVGDGGEHSVEVWL